MYTERCVENTQRASISGRMKTRALVQEAEEKGIVCVTEAARYLGGHPWLSPTCSCSPLRRAGSPPGSTTPLLSTSLQGPQGCIRPDVPSPLLWLQIYLSAIGLPAFCPSHPENFIFSMIIKVIHTTSEW